MQWTFLDGTFVSGPKAKIPIPSGRLSALAAVLVLNHGRAVERDRIAEILWEGEHPENARDRLNTMLWRLRTLMRKAGGKGKSLINKRAYLIYQPETAFGSDIVNISQTARHVMSHGATGATGTTDATSATADAQVQHLLDCVGDCNMDFLPGAQDHWSIVTRESLRSGLLVILEALLVHMREQGRWGRVSEVAQKMLTLDPALESGHRQMIELHSRRHDVGSAERQYSVLQRVLRDRLDVAPAPETAAAIDALKINRSEQANPAQNTGQSTGQSTGRPRRQALLSRPSFSAVESALDHLDAARDKLMG
ncbi:MAG: BTAD domain-containing putative transcriptional regulator [Roseovarius sp.]